MRLVRTGRAAGPKDRTEDGEAGQSLVEFALIVTPLFMLLLGIIQFGFIFNSYVTLTNAARDAAREGTVQVYDRTLSKDLNDLVRNEKIRTTLLGSMNLMSKTAPRFTTGSTWTATTGTGTKTYTNGDLRITYTLPTGISESDPRTGQQVTVVASYHQDLIVPLISELLPRDTNGRLVLTGEVTMVVN
jgi:Flp pilus assembly protein TadG